jgi:hypothetical protein
MKQIKEAAIKNGTFMKAPNGKPTNLNEKQWLQVRTKAFKEWFGDWEAAIINLAERVWNGNNARSRFDFAASDKLKQELAKILGKDIKTVFITDSDIQHIKNKHGANENQRGQIDVKPEDFALIPFVMNEFDAVQVSHPDNKGNKSIEFSKRINGTIYIIGVERGKSKEQIIAMWKKPSRMPNANTLSRTSGTTPNGTVNVQQISATLQNSAKDSSKIVDSNGEPMVVYHETTAEFSAFKKGSDNGIHFGTKDQAKERGSGILMEAFLNIPKLKMVTDKMDGQRN